MSAKKDNLDTLHEAAHLAKAELDEVAAAWTNFRLDHGKVGACAASLPGRAGHELFKARAAAAAKYRAAVGKLAEARLQKGGQA